MAWQGPHQLANTSTNTLRFAAFAAFSVDAKSPFAHATARAHGAADATSASTRAARSSVTSRKHSASRIGASGQGSFFTSSLFALSLAVAARMIACDT